VIAKAGDAFEPVWQQPIETAADADLLHIDDTYARVLTLNETLVDEIRDGKDPHYRRFHLRRDRPPRGPYHGAVLHLAPTRWREPGQRARDAPPERGPRIQVTDALSHNTSGAFESIVAKCLAHARRHFADVAASFPDEVEYVLTSLREVLRNDPHTRQQPMTGAERLAYPPVHSAPVMAALQPRMTPRSDERKIEPNSPLGRAFAYPHHPWQGLT